MARILDCAAMKRACPIDFYTINRAALAFLGPVLWRLAPGGKVIAGEYVVCNPRRADNRPGSFKVRFSSQRAGAWADFATVRRRRCEPMRLSGSCTQGEPARRLVMMLGIDAEGRR